ncbi:hypothetical protein [Bacillus sp. T33-2]|uniref:hypothetical protein n=1 Tax=Bacillus sp. T33-2 TaxID=2054168 RepID=UPI000C772573|nr:hypothetical protein [Bacillus sp. T33-2]PLR91141.1 hypothetical protein CVD19_21950 [Bacillus sp. T33-2]
MNDIDEQKCIFESFDDNGNMVLKGEVTGESEVHFYDDLKLKSVIALLNSVDQKNFNRSGRTNLFHGLLKEIEDMIHELKTFEEFQGKTH